jgi:hypothetical protein
MTSTIISDTITAVVEQEIGYSEAEQYSHVIAKVSEGLTKKAYEATDVLIHTAVHELGVSEDVARQYIEQSGLPVRPLPEPEPVVVEAPAVEAEQLSDTDRIRLLEEGQRKQGESLGKLLELADKIGTHLGLND